MKQRLKAVLEAMLRVVDRSPGRRRVLGGVFARYYKARGADPVIVDDAMAQATQLPAAATRSTMRWAAALEGGASMPRGYRPDRRLQSLEARAAALATLDRLLGAEADPALAAQLNRQRSYLLSDRGPDDPELRAFVETALDQRLSEFAVSAPPEKALDPQAGFELLRTLHDTLSAAGMRPFLVSGTLLGVVRNGALLAHDYDLDIGLLPGDGTAQQVADLLGSVDGLTVTVEEWRVWGTHENGVAFDVFVHYEERGRYYHATRTHRWWNSAFELVATDLNGTSFWIPDDVETYLAENYGKWETPTAFYHKSFDTPNREYCQTTDALLYLYELVVNSTGRKDRFVCESAVRELHYNFGIDLRHHFSSSVLLDPGADTSLDRRG